MRTKVTTRPGAHGAGPQAWPPAGPGTGMRAGRRADMTAYARYKREILGSLSGTVLEIGAGHGANFGYLAAGIDWIGLEPDPAVRPGLATIAAAPLCRRLAAGCDPARETWRAIAAAGFRDVQFRWFSPRPAFGLYSHYLGGTAHA